MSSTCASRERGKGWMSIESDGEGTLRIPKDPPMEGKVNEPVISQGVFFFGPSK